MGFRVKVVNAGDAAAVLVDGSEAAYALLKNEHADAVAYIGGDDVDNADNGWPLPAGEEREVSLSGRQDDLYVVGPGGAVAVPIRVLLGSG